MENRFLVSIIMPAYNAEKYIAEAIESVIDQTYKNWELIIINDGSIDKTEEIIKSYDDKRVIYLKQNNKGVSSARNRGLELAKGEYITFLDADDMLPSKSLKKRVAYMKNNPTVDLVDGKIVLKDENMLNTLREYQPYYNGDLLPKLLNLDDRVFFGVCYFFKKEILENTLFRDKMTHSEDLLFYIELANKKQMHYASIPDEIYIYRTGHVSAMTDLNKLENGYLQLIQEVKKLQNISKIDFFILKIKIAKIMFLSWLSHKKITNAIKSVFYIWQIIQKENL